MSLGETAARGRVGRRKWRVLSALAVTAALAVAGCSSGSKSSGSTNPSGSAGGNAAGKTITVWHYFSDKNQVKVMTDYAELFEKSHPGTKVDNVFVPYDQINSKLISAAGAKTGPDVAVFNGADTSTVALGGALASLDKEWSAFSDAGQFPNSVVHKLDGHVYGVQGYVNLLGLWYNADLLDKLGLKPPTTIDELEADMAAAKKAGYQGITLSGLPNSQGEWQAYPWLTSEGFNYENLDKSKLEAALSRVRGWVEKGYLSQEAATWDQTVPFQKFAAGNVLFAENGNWQLGTAESTAKFKYNVVELPLSSDGKVYLGGEAQGVGAFSKNPDLAWEYLKTTYFSAEGQLIALKNVGSIPSRADAAKDQAVSSNSLLKPFADTIANKGSDYPAAIIPPKSVADVEVAVGQAWSSAIAGQSSPSSAAGSAVNALKGLVQK